MTLLYFIRLNGQFMVMVIIVIVYSYIINTAAAGRGVLRN